MKKIAILLLTIISFPVFANDKVTFCQEYKQHLSTMRAMEAQQNFSYNSKEWKAAQDKKEVLIETGKLLFGDDVRITNACSGLLNMMNMKQFQTFQ